MGYIRTLFVLGFVQICVDFLKPNQAYEFDNSILLTYRNRWNIMGRVIYMLIFSLIDDR